MKVKKTAKTTIKKTSKKGNKRPEKENGENIAIGPPHA